MTTKSTGLIARKSQWLDATAKALRAHMRQHPDHCWPEIFRVVSCGYDDPPSLRKAAANRGVRISEAARARAVERAKRTWNMG